MPCAEAWRAWASGYVARAGAHCGVCAVCDAAPLTIDHRLLPLPSRARARALVRTGTRCLVTNSPLRKTISYALAIRSVSSLPLRTGAHSLTCASSVDDRLAQMLCVVPHAEAHVSPVPVDGDALHGPQRVGRRRGERGMRRGSWEELGDGATDVPPCSCPVGAPDGRRNSSTAG